MKIVTNECYGGFSLSKKGFEYYNQLRITKGLEPIKIDTQIEDKSNKLLIKTIEDLGEEANGLGSRLEIHEIHDSNDIIEYDIIDYDGYEPVSLKSYDENLKEKLMKIKQIINKFKNTNKEKGFDEIKDIIEN